jgi:hypothetical protein
MDMLPADIQPDDLSWPSEQEAATMTVQDWLQFYARQRYREHDSTLLALQATATAIQPACTALCSIHGHAHGYTLQFTVVQFEGLTFRWYDWDAATQQLREQQPADLNLDLQVEFQRLCNGQIDVAHFQPTSVGFVMPAEAFRPAAGEVQHVLDHNRISTITTRANLAAR